MSTSWKVENKEERGGKEGEKYNLKFIIIKWNKINDRMNEMK